MTFSSRWVGNCSLLGYVAVTALSSILIHDANQNVPPLISAFYTFLFCTLVYNVTTRKLLSKMEQIKKYKFELLVLNVTTTICWIGAFISLKYIRPELFLFVYLCAMPIASGCLYRKNLIKTLVLMLGVVLLVSTYHEKDVLLGSFLAFSGGFFGTIYSIYSKKIAAEFSTGEILSLRFYLIVLVTFILNIYCQNSFVLTIHFYWQFALLCLVSVVLPLSLFQIGLKHLDLTKALSFVPLAPILCYLFSFFVNHQSVNLMQIFIIMLLTLTMLPDQMISRFIKRKVYVGNTINN